MVSDNLTERLTQLSPAKRSLLELRLKQKGANVSIQPIIPRREKRDSAPLSFAQQRLWFLNQLEPESPTYNQPKAMRLCGRLDVPALEKALDEIVGRHEVLRTTFLSVDGNPVQVVAENRGAELPVIDLQAWPNPAREAEVRRLIVETIRRPFDLSRDLMLRALLLRLADEEHILLLVTHHVASDGWSTGILWQELTDLYRAFSFGQPSYLQELPVQYADYAAWQRAWLQGEVFETQLSYWKKHLEGVSTLQLPTDRPRPPIQSFRGGKQSLTFPKDLSEALKALSRREGVTLFMTLLAAFQALLYRYTGQEDIAVGSPIAGRNRPEIEGLIGFFVNTLVLRTSFSGNPSFLELLQRVREVALGAYAHQDLPFEKLVEELQPERNLGNSPLFQVLFVHQNIPRQTVQLSGISLTPLEVDSGTAKFDLTVSVREAAEGLRGYVEYSSDLFDDATIRRMLAHFQMLLEGIAANPEQPLSSLPFLTVAERAQLLVELNQTSRDYPRDQCIHQLFEEQVEKTPGAVAVVFPSTGRGENQQLTYRELNQKANQVARYLRSRGVGPEVFVGLCLERCLEMAVAMLGILKAGAAYVPLDPEYPRERLLYMLQDSQAPVLLTQKKLVEELFEDRRSKTDDDDPRCSILDPQLEMVCLDASWEMIARHSEENLTSIATANNPAYMIYTSGSTGKPKGVVMEHRPLCNLISWQMRSWIFPGKPRTLQFTPLSFDVSFQEIFSAWCSGGTLVLISEEARRDPTALLHCLATNSVERLFLPSIALQHMAEAAETERSLPLSLCEIITAGEQLQITRQIASLLERLKGCHLWNQYGPSETHVVTYFTLTEPPKSWPGLPPIGRPIANTQIYLLDRHLQPVPIGAPGELYIGGDALARGYHNRPELTAERFIANPFSTIAGERLYRTGDLARYQPDGNIEFLGRIDHQVKIRGHRTEPGEIETILAQHPGVREAVVIAREDVPGDPSASLRTGKRLVAYVVPNKQQDSAPQDLRLFLKQKVPEYMVPSSFVTLEKLPLTPNGKIDRRALPAPDRSRLELKETFVAPRTSAERMMAVIWRDTLNIPRVGIHDNFFDLGGHSLLAVKLMAEIRRDVRVDLPLQALFEAPTIAQLASRVESKRREDVNHRREGGQSSPLIELQSGPGRKRIFCFPFMGGIQAEFFNFSRVARHFGPDYSFYGLRVRGFDGAMAPHRSVQKMAADYVKAIKSLQPHGPYFLVGECLGGLTAYETAQQLQADGEKVALLAFFDTRAGASRPYLWRWFSAPLQYRLSVSWSWNYVFTRAGLHLKAVKQQSAASALRYLFDKAIKGIKAVPFLINVERSGLPNQDNGNGLNGERDVTPHVKRAEKAFKIANRRYRVKPYTERISLLVNERSYGSNPTHGWADYVPKGLDVYKLPGDHDTCVPENIPLVASILKECLEKAEREV